MGLFFWKNNKAIDAFAKTVAEDLFSHVRPDVAKRHILGAAKKTKKQDRRIEQKFADVAQQLRRFAETKSLGIYGKARLQMKFNERLNELGYDADVVNRLAEKMLLGGT